jgi:subtilisin family serine protease
MLRQAALAGVLVVLLTGEARAQPPRVRLAGAADCPRNVNCIPGFQRVYHFDPTPFFVQLKVADAGVQALDNGDAEVAVAFSSNPQLSRPDIVTLRDDRHMISSDHVVPIVRRRVLDRYGAPLRRRLNAASRLLTTLELRGLNQQVLDGRLPEAVGGEFADANGLGGPAVRRRRGPRIVLAFQDFAENRTLAFFYAEALRGAGFRVRVRNSGGLRPAVVRAMRRRRIDMWPGYSGSLLGYLGGRSLRRALVRIGAQPLALSPAQDRNGFAMKRDVAESLGIHKLSDLARYWPAATASAARAAGGGPVSPNDDSRQGDQWAVSPPSVLNLPGAWKLSKGVGVTVAIVDSGALLTHVDLGPNIWTNFDEIPGNHVDDDHNGFVDDVHGVDLSTTRPSQNLSDGLGHGTHVAGIVAAAQNGRGVVGIAPRAKLMIVKVLSATGAGTTGGVAQGIRYAAANGARIINLSLGGDTPDPRLNDAIKAAAAANALVVTSAGNNSRDIDRKPSYPASIAAPNLITVAATQPKDGRGIDPASNFGRLDVQLAAPGAGILSTANDGGYVLKSGTSMAAPMVSGVAALMAGANPRISAVAMRALLLQNANRSRLPVAAGYVDALNAVLAASTAAGPDTTQAPQLKLLGASRKGKRVRIQAAVLGATAAIKRYLVSLNGRTVAQLGARPSPFTVTVRRRSGRRVRIRAVDASGRTLTSARGRVVKLRKGKRGVKTGSGVGT